MSQSVEALTRRVAELEQRLQICEERFHSLISNNPVAMLVVDEVGMVLYANSSGEQLLGLAPGDSWDQPAGAQSVGRESCEIDFARQSGSASSSRGACHRHHLGWATGICYHAGRRHRRVKNQKWLFGADSRVLKPWPNIYPMWWRDSIETYVVYIRTLLWRSTPDLRQVPGWADQTVKWGCRPTWLLYGTDH